ncbi:adenosine deaminase family protein [Acetobacter oeni]|uniref:adenosine deaminase n=1 Tax=Acetobacter oeni TaxID=304077 RepID=A0A511XN81_9PROT|nr:adenosine deaminase [Acetobacter oeni]MBB3884245.1 adenosine deaminase [Acetobacter oeni]NHO20165.1 adenosine deaminase [Acetobacter oeni]GBR01021.1 adenosine deaminase [Acetobacter oeni LMG 21952]GEN64397.1 adenosine deaminase [Acetobacter oeni]
MIRHALTALFSLTVAHGALAATAATQSDFDATTRHFEAIRSDPEQLLPFLRAFPKGSDLHNHLVGAIYAEHMLAWATQDQFCVNPETGAIGPTRCTPGIRSTREGVAARTVTDDPALYGHEIDLLSMRNFVPTATDRSGHDHFFATFDRFMPATLTHDADMLADALNQAGYDHVKYVELMISPQIMPVAGLGAGTQIAGEADFARAIDTFSPRFAPMIQVARNETDNMENGARTLMKCGTPDATPGCGVSVRYLYQTLRTMPPGMVMAQLSFGYALVRADTRFVGINIVAPEDNPVAMRDYTLHMQMFRALSAHSPDVKLSLHAGELTGGLVPPEGMRAHIRQAVEIAGAKRIGHGVDIMQERDPYGLLAEMTKRGVMVEINLTSNDEILGVRGKAHPLMAYRAAHVPVALSTDDEGVSRSNLTNEYVRAALTYPLSYDDLRDLSRTGLEHAFLPGDSLWSSAQPYHVTAVCSGIAPGSAPHDGACHDFLAHSEKARLQWALEGDFAGFEHAIAAGAAPAD